MLSRAPRAIYTIDWVSTYEAGLAALAKQSHDICVTDVHLGARNGIDLIRESTKRGWTVPFVVMSGSSGTGQVDIPALQAGASDFVSKQSMSDVWLDRSIQYTLERHALLRQVKDQGNALEATETRFQAVAESGQDGLVILDEEGVLRYANTAASQTWGPELSALTIRLMRDRRGGSSVGEVPGTNGSPRTIEARVASLEWKGEPASVLTIRETTHQVELEGRLRQSQKMEAVGQLTGGVAHDLNNTLAIIISCAELLMEEGKEGERVDLETIQSAAHRGADLIRKLLAFGRRQRLDLKRTPPLDIVQEFLSLARRLLPESIEIILEAPGGTGQILADSGALIQVLLNLATNARDAMPAGGTLTISVGVRELSQRNDPDLPSAPHVTISVSDTGAGMDPATLARAFEPFFTTKPLGEGTGLGLAMVYGLVEQHLGFIDAESTLGKGTSVRIHLPIVAETALLSAGTPAVRAANPRGTETILLVEDLPPLRAMARRVLERAGYRVIEAINGEEGLAATLGADGPIGLVLTDLVMPKMSGPELARRLRIGTPDLPIIFTSGYPWSPGSGGELAAGEILLNKPWSVEELLVAVRRALDRPRP
jgi:signal transduction histidine kinase